MNIGYDFNNNSFINNEKQVNEKEKSILEDMFNHLQCDPADLKIVANSTDYSTLQYNDVDIVRVKSTNATQWIKILISNVDRKNEIDNPLFMLQNKKGESMWKCSIYDLDNLYPFINRAIEMIDSWKK